MGWSWSSLMCFPFSSLHSLCSSPECTFFEYEGDVVPTPSASHLTPSIWFILNYILPRSPHGDDCDDADAISRRATFLARQGSVVWIPSWLESSCRAGPTHQWPLRRCRTTFLRTTSWLSIVGIARNISSAHAITTTWVTPENNRAPLFSCNGRKY
jgi:hypothetical protein